MKTSTKIVWLSLCISYSGWAQTGHIMQGAGAVNMSMGGAATAQPTDISGALLWNPAAITAFDKKILSINIGGFSASPELSSSLPAGMLGPGAPAVSGTTKDDKGISVMPTIAMVWGKPDSKHTIGLSAFGVSGFGVTFPEEANNPLNSSFNPGNPSNPINYPQQAGGFGRIESNYMVLQVSVAYAYKLSEKVSIGIQPNFNYHALKLAPNPTSSPDPAKGYPTTDNTSSIGYGGQVGIFFDSKTGFKLGASYKTTQYFSDLEFKNTYLDGTAAPSNKFNMNFPSIISVGTGYSKNNIDVALDYRLVSYENTNGFADEGWTSTASVKGFGWNNISVVSFGIQYKGIDKFPIRAGYTYSTNPIDPKLAFFSVPATAIIKNAFQVGMGYELSERVTLNGVFHYGTSGGATSGELLSPLAITPANPFGAIPGTKVSYTMTTSMFMLGLNYILE